MSPRRIVVLLSVLVLAGSAAMAAGDQDRDGVKDRKDLCADTPVGTRVDPAGCPVDTDADGIFDGLDRCGKTPEGWPVDDTGCPLDTDTDGVPDGEDTCPGTRMGARVDTAGCASDSDGDGILDGLDRCAGTMASARVDEYGCAIDSDHDGVPDGIDQCPGTRYKVQVEETGCKPKASPLFPGEQMTIVLDGVTFGKSSAAIDDRTAGRLTGVAESLQDWPEVRIEIRAYTDSAGGSGNNLDLSRRRAEAVKAFLVAKGIDPGRLTARGMGEKAPIADNSTPEGRRQNRRVELVRLAATSQVAADE